MRFIQPTKGVVCELYKLDLLVSVNKVTIVRKRMNRQHVTG